MTASRRSVSIEKDWQTPPVIVDVVTTMFGVPDLDPCSNRRCLIRAATEWALPDFDGLALPWDDYVTIYVNPPYGRNGGTSIKDWLRKCADAASAGSEVLALVPVATNTTYWHRFVFPTATSICFLKFPRLRFYLDGVEYKKGAPMSCCLIYWGNESALFATHTKAIGATLELGGGRWDALNRADACKAEREATDVVADAPDSAPDTRYGAETSAIS